MKSVTSAILLVTSLALAVPPTSTPALQGGTITVTNTADSGSGTLRQAMEQAQSGDTITFDPVIFPPTAPVTISLTSSLPPVTQGDLTIDGSNAGVVLDGSTITDEPVSDELVFGLNIESDGNIIRGLQITSFPGAAVGLQSGAQNNIVGGDRGIGAGPLGQGNLFSGNGFFGIGFWNEDTSFNTITGNYIGTDVSGLSPLANLETGVIIDLGAHDNVIGPGNIIAHNGGEGINVGLDSVGNTITQNSIHDNGRQGITLSGGGNTELLAPLMLDFDLTAGTVSGLACSNCTVEVFSDDNFEGETYEGTTTADSLGLFSFSRGASLAGPRLTATATDAGGNTSSFSAPTYGTSRSTDLQEGNNLPKTRLQARQSRELADNRIGTGSAFERRPLEPHAGPYLDQVNNVGQKWILALTIDWLEWDPVETNGEYSIYYIDPTHDDAVTGLADLGIEMVYSLAFWDEEIVPTECYSRFKKEDEIQRYLDYVQFLVHNFKDRIEYYEMINEPRYNECAPFHQQNIALDDYIELVKRTEQVIHQEYPEAKIVVGATVLFYEDYYLSGILESDIMPLVDGVSWHPFYGQSPEYEPEYYYDYPSTVQEIKDVASAHGFKGEYIVEELTWGVGYPTHPWTYGETVTAKYYARGIMMHLGMDVIVGFAGGNEPPEEQWRKFTVIRNLSTVMAGAEPATLPVQIQTTATNTVTYTFSSSDDDHLVALWTDGVAMEYDPGITATVTIPGFTDHTVTGIDVLHDFEQPVMASEEDGNLVIRDLLVRDYPIILRLSPTRYVFLPVVVKGHPR